MKIHQFTELDNVPLIFDDETEKIFFKEFVPVEKDFCPKCDSEDIQHYQDLFICFNCKKKSSSKFWQIVLKNGYLSKRKDNEILFFHRFVMDAEIKKILPYKRKEFHVHHHDGNKLNNSKSNLKLMDAKEHFALHKSISYWKAFNTWCEKRYGHPDESYFEEFKGWLNEKKEGEYV